MYRFIDKHNLGEPYDHIHPYQQIRVRELVNRVFDGITHVIIFGSSVNLTCKPNSDLDVCVIGDFDTDKIKQLRIKDVAMDVLHYKDAETLKDDYRIYREVTERGVQVYG